MQTCAPVSARHLVDPDGLAALRLAIAMARDPYSGRVHEHLAFRSVSDQPGVGTLGTPVAPAQHGLPPQRTVEQDVDAPAIPKIPTPATPAEPMGEQIPIMELVKRAQTGDGEAFGQL
jgi:hypothetical protein